MENYHKFVNLTQTPEERQGKYWLARSLGMNSSWASKMMDWRLSKIERFFNIEPIDKSLPEASRLHSHAFQFVLFNHLAYTDNMPP